jgi:magnesium-transporting ATPase (P-type)
MLSRNSSQWQEATAEYSILCEELWHFYSHAVSINTPDNYYLMYTCSYHDITVHTVHILVFFLLQAIQVLLKYLWIARYASLSKCKIPFFWTSTLSYTAHAIARTYTFVIFFVTMQNSIMRNVFITVLWIRVRIRIDSDFLDPDPGKEGKTDKPTKIEKCEEFSCFEVWMLLRKPGQWTSYKET